MSTARSRPRFFWQGLLIVLPVVVLAGFALFSLRQDKVLVELEVRDRAQSEANEIADRLWSAIADPKTTAAFKAWELEKFAARPFSQSEKDALNPAFLFQVDGAGHLVFPPPVTVLPEPRPLRPSQLNADQSVLWQKAQSIVADPSTSLADVSNSCSQFLQLAPPDAFAAAAHFQLGLRLAGEGRHAEASQEFEAVVTTFPEAFGESGLPLRPLALLKSAEQIARIADADPARVFAPLAAACSNAIMQPSLITPQMLEAASRLEAAAGTNISAPWQALWQQQQTARALHGFAQSAFMADFIDGKHRRAVDYTNSMALPDAADFRDSAPPRLFWFAAPLEFLASDAGIFSMSGRSKLWLATRVETGTNGHWFLCRPALDEAWHWRVINAPSGDLPQPTITTDRGSNWVDLAREWHRRDHPSTDPLVDEVEKQRARLPDYFGLSLELAGRQIIPTNMLPPFPYIAGEKGRGQSWKKSASATSPPLLASSHRVEDGIEYLRVGIHLTKPDLLYARQHTRTQLFGLLIGTSALAAVIGFVSARRAFRRQQQLAEMKSNFVSSVSHELRAPIASVRLMAESLERGKIPEPVKQREYFRFIVQECRRLGRLIENVLDFSRIEQGREQYEFEPTDLPALVRQTAQLMEPVATEREVSLSVTLPDASSDFGEAQPNVDGAALQQALVNLLDNAIKHSPPRAVVTIDLAFDATSASFRLSVADTGPGIPAEDHERIFERFYRRGSELRRETQGVGIGLSIVKHVTEAHGGRVRVVSQVGEGSRFVIEVPMRKAEQVQSSKLKAQKKCQ